MKSHGDIFTDFYDKEMPNVDSNHTCLAVISMDSSLKKDDSYYPQVFFKECRCLEEKIIRHIINDYKSYSVDSVDSNDSDEESDKAMRLMFFENVFFERVTLKKKFKAILFGG